MTASSSLSASSKRQSLDPSSPALRSIEANDDDDDDRADFCTSVTTLVSADSAEPVSVSAAQALGDDRPMYFLDNFLCVMEHAARHCSQLLSDDERVWFAEFASLDRTTQGLFVRLFNRKLAWFRVDKLAYDELGPSAALRRAARSLVELGWLLELPRERSVMPERAVIALLRKPELVPLAVAANVANSSKCNKQELIDAIQAFRPSALGRAVGTANPLVKRLLIALGDCVRLDDARRVAFKRAEALYFVGMSLDPAETQQVMTLAHLRGLQWPPYVCRPELALFPSREAMLGYEEATRLLARADDALLIGDDADDHVASCALFAATERLSSVVSEARDPLGSRSLIEDVHTLLAFTAQFDRGLLQQALLKPGAHFADHPHLWQFSNTRVAMRIVSHCVVVSEHAKKYGDASVYYRMLLAADVPNQRRGDWFDRLCIMLEHLGKRSESLKIAESALSDATLRRSDVITLRARVVRLARPPLRLLRPKLLHPEPRDAPTRTFFGKLGKRALAPGESPEKAAAASTLWISADGSLKRVEEFALECYANEGWRGLHCEGGVFGMLLMLLLWDVMWMDVPGAFVTPNQTAPLDLSTDCFYARRRDAIDAALNSLREESRDGIRARVESIWPIASKVQCRGVNWQQHDSATAATMAACVGGRGLAAVFSCFCKVTHRRSGMPDLFLWNEEKLAARLSEVKSPNDRLSDKQVAWLETFMDNGISCEVCLIRTVADDEAKKI
jgi:Fanconi-associated nuclease 1